MATNTGALEVCTPRPRDDHLSLHEQLLTSFSSRDSSEAAPTTSPQKPRQRTLVQFVQPQELRKCGGAEGIKVDEVDGDHPTPAVDTVLSRKNRSRNCSVLRCSLGPRSASGPARRRTLSRGGPISRDTTSDQPDAPGMTPEEIARELRPESFTRFKRITLSRIENENSTRQENSASQVITDTNCNLLEADMKQVNTDRTHLEESGFPANSSREG